MHQGLRNPVSMLLVLIHFPDLAKIFTKRILFPCRLQKKCLWRNETHVSGVCFSLHQSIPYIPICVPIIHDLLLTLFGNYTCIKQHISGPQPEQQHSVSDMNTGSQPSTSSLPLGYFITSSKPQSFCARWYLCISEHVHIHTCFLTARTFLSPHTFVHLQGGNVIRKLNAKSGRYFHPNPFPKQVGTHWFFFLVWDLIPSQLQVREKFF